MKVHVGESDEGDDGGGDGGVPDHGHCVPEDVGRVLPGPTREDKVGSVRIYDFINVNRNTFNI